jgi:hypothetical protein
MPTALAGEFAYPMLCRGHLVGALVVRPKTTGGRYTLDLDDVVVLEATARLDELHVPKTVAAGVMREVRNYVRRDPHWRAWVVYTGDDNILLVKSDRDVQHAAERGAAAQLIYPDIAREQLAHRLEHLPAQRKRGRPRYDSEWVQRALRESAKLGPERASAEEASQLRPPMEWPWKKNA